LSDFENMVGVACFKCLDTVGWLLWRTFSQ